MKNKQNKKQKPRRNPYHEVMRTLFKPKTIPDKKKQNNKKACREKVREA
jgi:hypothetical protein